MSTQTPKIRISTHSAKIGLRNAWTTHWGSRDSLLVSQGHKRNKNGGYDSGGPFWCVKETLQHDRGEHLEQVMDFGVDYGACFIKGISTAKNDFGPYPVQPTFQELQDYLKSQYSASGFKATRPGNPIASAGQFLIELRNDGLPGLPLRSFYSGGLGLRRNPDKTFAWRSFLTGGPFQWIPLRAKSHVEAFRAIGDEYLNAAFGWKPFVSDLRKMYNLWHTIDRRMAQLVRNNGKTRRRSAVLENSSSTEKLAEESWGHPGLNCAGFPTSVIQEGHSYYLVTKRSTLKVWYSSRYTYNIPDIGSSAWDRRARLALFGANPTPELIWNVLPWSWLTDWFVNVGDVLSNFSDNAVDNLTQSSDYIMMNRKDTTNWQCITKWEGRSTGGRWPTRFRRGEHTFFTEYSVEQKVRTAGGSPYQLAPKMDSFTGDHLGILAALGISKGLR